PANSNAQHAIDVESLEYVMRGAERGTRALRSLRREATLRVADAAVQVVGAGIALRAERRVHDGVTAKVRVHATCRAAARAVGARVAFGAEVALLRAIDDHVAAEGTEFAVC